MYTGNGIITGNNDGKKKTKKLSSVSKLTSRILSPVHICHMEFSMLNWLNLIKSNAQMCDQGISLVLTLTLCQHSFSIQHQYHTH